MEEKGGFATKIDDGLAAFIANTRSFYFATANRDGQPYIQHRGGPKGFLRVLDPTTLAFADFSGNRQYITTGNLADNPRAMLFLMDYTQRKRVKIWGTARVVEDEPELIARLFPDGYKARAEQAIVFTGHGLGRQLPAAHPANAVCRGCRRGHRGTQSAHRRARSRECPIARSPHGDRHYLVLTLDAAGAGNSQPNR